MAYYVDHQSKAASGALQTIGVILILQALVKFGFWAYSISSIITILQVAPERVLGSPQLIIFSIALPLLVIIGGLAAGGLLLGNVENARGFALAFCGIALLYSMYNFGNVIYALSSRPNFHWPLVYWIMAPVHMLIYLISIIVVFTNRRQ